MKNMTTIPLNLLGKIKNGAVYELSIYDESNIDPREWSKLGDALQANAALQNREEDIVILNLHDVNFGCQGIREVAKFLQVVSTVQQLNLANTQIDQDGMLELIEGIANQNHLTHLSLANNALSDAAVCRLLEILADKPLVQLDLSGVKLTEASANALAKFLSNNTSIQILYLQNNALGGAIPVLQDGLRYNHSLRQIDLSHNHLSDRDLLMLAQIIQENNQLTQVCLNGNSLEGCADEFFGLLTNHSHNKPLALEALLIENTSLRSVTGLCQFLAQPNQLKTLSLSDNALQVKQFAQLASAVRQAPSLQRLFLKHIDINHSMRESLLELLSEAKQLRHLNLSNNPISAQIHNDIQMELETNNHLVVLELIDTNITDTVAKAYAQSLSKNTELKGLELSQNNITCDGLKSLSLALRKNYRLEALTLDQNPWQQEYMAFQDEPRHMVENICERLKKTFGSKDENALHWIFNVSIFKAIDDFEQWPDIIECPSDKQKELLSQLELALVVRELFRNCHDNLELNQIIDHHKPEEGLMKLMSLMAQRQNIAEQHFVALADKIQMIKEHFKLQEVMESIEVEDMMPGFKEKFLEHVKNTLVSSPEVEQDFESEKNSDCEESSVEESDESLLEPSKTFTPSYKTANGVPTVTLEVTEEQRAVFEAAMKDITSKQQKEQDKKENASVLSSLFTRRHK